MLKTLRPEDDRSVDESAFREALRHFASGVTIISTVDDRGQVHGMTATAFSSLSLRPPLILVAVAQGSRCHRLVKARGRFGVSVLYDRQTQISRHFGGAPSPGFTPAFERIDDAPVLETAMVQLACTLDETLSGGDHSIFIGKVTAAVTRPGAPLLHFAGSYHTLEPLCLDP